jgi:hypothetical protein
MKYLRKRENYLQEINERRKVELEKSVQPILETYAMEGPFRNDIRWGDSLVGRILHSITRKAIIATKVVRIKFVVERLKQAMDELLITSTISSLDDDDKKLWSKVVISEFLSVIKDAIDDYGKDGDDTTIDDIKGYVDEAIKRVESEENLENKNELLRQLNELKKFLEPLEEPGKSEEQINKEKTEDIDERIKEIENELENEDISDDEREELEKELERLKEVKGEVEKQPDVAGENSTSSSYPTMIKALKSLSILLSNYKKVQIKSNKEVAHKTSLSYVTKGGETIEGIQKDVNINKSKLTIEQIWAANSKGLQSYLEKAEKLKSDKNKLQLAKGLTLALSVIKESYIFESSPIQKTKEGSPVGIGSGAGVERNVVSSGESHAVQAYVKIKKACEILESPKEKGIGVTTDFINSIVSKSVDENVKKEVKSLFFEINRFLVGDKKETLNSSVDPLFKESVEIISDKNKKIVVAEKIARFTKRALQFDGQNLYGELGDFGKPLSEFVESFKLLSKMNTTKSEKKSEVKEKLLSYSSFINNRIFEADEDKSGVEDLEPRKALSVKIQDYFEKKIDFSAWVIDRSEIEATKTSLEKKIAENKDNVVIDGIDPILDIVRCFNRAYKLHTIAVIPSNRTGGAVSNAIFNEYESFGSGGPATAGASGGPYRNKMIFNQWEDAVLKMLGKREYQKIFNVGTRLKNGNDYIEKAGSNLRKFMNDMLDGDSLYKGDGKEGGTQARFLDKYFGYKDGESNPGSLSLDGDRGEIEDNNRNADAIKPIKLKSVPEGIKFENNSEIKNTFFLITGTVDNTPTNLYCYVHNVLGDLAFISYSKTSYHIKNYIQKSSTGQAVELGDERLTKEKSQEDKKGTEFKIRATTMKISEFMDKTGKWKNSSSISIRPLEKKSKKEDDKTIIDNSVSNKDFELGEASIYQSVKFWNLVDLEKGSNADSYQRVKASDKEVEDFIKQKGGFLEVNRIKDIDKSQIKNR